FRRALRRFCRWSVRIWHKHGETQRLPGACGMTRERMASLRHGFEEAGDEQDIRLVVDTIPTLAWSAGPDGSAEFFNQRWLNYTGLSAKQAVGSGWEVTIHPDDLNDFVDYWRRVVASGQ